MASIAFTAPHAAVSEIGMDLLRSGASAVDATIAAAAAISVAYPHMNSIGGDGFWLISKPGHTPLGIDAAGCSLSGIQLSQYKAFEHRGPKACITLPGTVKGWSLAREYGKRHIENTQLPLAELFAPAIELAHKGVEVSESLASACNKLDSEIDKSLPEFKTLDSVYLSPIIKDLIVRVANPALGNTFQHLAKNGLNDFYEGDVASALIASLQSYGSLVKSSDLQDYTANYCEALSINNRFGKVFNLPAPTQGISSLLILALFDQFFQEGMGEASQVHYLVEATKQAFRLRDQYIGDPEFSKGIEKTLLSDSKVKELMGNISHTFAAPWPDEGQPGDTIWMGCVDRQGVMVSFIQSVYWEFGSGVMCPTTGIIWNNRGCSFSLNPNHTNVLAPKKRPLHTLNPAYAEFNDGRRMVYGTMGGDGQPQTQAAIYTRFAYNNMNLSEAIKKGRWLLGRTWGDVSTDLKIEDKLADVIENELQIKGHKIKKVPYLNEMMGHAGGICIDPSGFIDCASDPRSDGAAFQS